MVKATSAVFAGLSALTLANAAEYTVSICYSSAVYVLLTDRECRSIIYYAYLAPRTRIRRYPVQTALT